MTEQQAYTVLRTKVAGVEGSFEQLLVKARFDEAKITDLATSQGEYRRLPPQMPVTKGGVDKVEVDNHNQVDQVIIDVLFATRGRSAPMEARGMSQVSTRSSPNRPLSATTANLQEDSIVGTQQNTPSKVERLRQELQATELEESLQNASVTTHGLSQGPSLDRSNK